jgi:hypothetical protein
MTRPRQASKYNPKSVSVICRLQVTVSSIAPHHNVAKGETLMKKFLAASLLFIVAGSAFASPRPCRDWRYDHHHHRYCHRY